MPAETTPQPMRTCPVCHGQFPITHHSTARHTYCSRRCRDIAATARDKAKDAQAEVRLAAAGNITSLAATGRTATASAPTRPVLEPAATRPCPHCGEPITIVALLTTPEAARPQLPNPPAPDVIPIRRGG